MEEGVAEGVAQPTPRLGYSLGRRSEDGFSELATRGRLDRAMTQVAGTHGAIEGCGSFVRPCVLDSRYCRFATPLATPKSVRMVLISLFLSTMTNEIGAGPGSPGKATLRVPVPSGFTLYVHVVEVRGPIAVPPMLTVSVIEHPPVPSKVRVPTATAGVAAGRNGGNIVP